MKARVIVPIFDGTAGCPRKPGDVFEVSEERFAEMNSTAAGTVVEAVEQPAEPARRASRKTVGK